MVCLVKNYKENTWNVRAMHATDLNKYRDCRPFHSCVGCGGQSLHDFLAEAFKHGPSLVMIYQEDIIILGPLPIDLFRVKGRRTLLDNLEGE